MHKQLACYCTRAGVIALTSSAAVIRCIVLATRQAVNARGGYSNYFTKSKSVHTLKGLALPRASHSGEIALAGSRRLHSTLAAAPVLFAYAVVTEIKNKYNDQP
jgi:hypothetical protein